MTVTLVFGFKDNLIRANLEKCSPKEHEQMTSSFFAQTKIWLLSSRDCFRLSPNHEIELLRSFKRI